MLMLMGLRVNRGAHSGSVQGSARAVLTRAALVTLLLNGCSENSPEQVNNPSPIGSQNGSGADTAQENGASGSSGAAGAVASDMSGAGGVAADDVAGDGGVGGDPGNGVSGSGGHSNGGVNGGEAGAGIAGATSAGGTGGQGGVGSGTGGVGGMAASGGSSGGPGNGGPFIVDFDTTAGAFAVEVHPEWAPLGVARFQELVETGFYDGASFFRVVPGFVVQFGLSGDPAVNAMWANQSILDDPVVQSNTLGTLAFATDGPDTRQTQLFINYADNSPLDGQGFSPFGQVIEGLQVVQAINAEYGERPEQERIELEGSAYLDELFPNLDAINTATIR